MALQLYSVLHPYLCVTECAVLYPQANEANALRSLRKNPDSFRKGKWVRIFYAYTQKKRYKSESKQSNNCGILL